MTRCFPLLSLAAVASVGLVSFFLASGSESSGEEAKKPAARKRAGEEEPADSKFRVPVATARDRAVQLHATLESTLHAMHRHYFPKERATVPARAMQDVFDDVARDSHMDVRWISVNIRAMSIDHEPESEFEKRAAKELAGGKESFELIEKGMYRRAGAIPLGAGCLTCHTTSFTPPSRAQKFAGLVISVPIAAE